MLLADPCPMGPSVSSRFRRSHCRHRRPWTWPGVWCKREGPFAAHEVLEARWKAGPDEERDLWQGLAQICVGLTHAARGNSSELSGSSSGGRHGSKSTTPATVRLTGSTYLRSLPARVSTWPPVAETQPASRRHRPGWLPADPHFPE
jgi:hypothetical protein